MNYYKVVGDSSRGCTPRRWAPPVRVRSWVWCRFPEILREICVPSRETISGNFQGNLRKLGRLRSGGEISDTFLSHPPAECEFLVHHNSTHHGSPFGLPWVRTNEPGVCLGQPLSLCALRPLNPWARNILPIKSRIDP